jgi:hypothetical protein
MIETEIVPFGRSHLWSLLLCPFVFFLQPKLLAKELLDLVASHFNLKEKEYFGIAFTDET